MDPVEKKETESETPAPKNSRHLFCLPAWLVRGKEEDFAKAGLKPRFKTANFDGFVIDVCLLSTGKQKYDLVVALAQALASSDAKEEWQTTSCIMGHRFLDLHCPLRINMLTVVDMDKLEAEEREEYAVTYALVFAYLRQLACLSGLRINYHANGGLPKAPQPDKDGEIHIYTNSRPPGDGIAKYIDSAFGIDLKNGLDRRIGHEPAAGRGTVLEDGKGPLVQIVGANVYFLIPVISDKDSGRQWRVFESMMKLAWDGLRAKPAKKKPARIRRGALKQMAQKWLDPAAKHIVMEIARCDTEIDVYRQKLATIYRVKREYEVFRDALKTSGFVEKELARVPKDTRRLTSHPRVASVELIQNGLHVGTKQIVIEHAGRRYPVGEFIIRIGQHGHVSVWNESPTHPKNESHPHINDDGTPCFGNIIDVITQAAGEHRYVDAVLHVLRWLEYGYTPAIARVKIETWPAEPLPMPVENSETVVPNNDGPTGNAPVAPEVFP